MTTHPIAAPPSTPEELVQEVLHGRVNSDPYRWLEDGARPAVRVWVAAQNAHAEAVLATVEARSAVSRQLAATLGTGTVQAPAQRGSRYFYERRDGTQNQPVLYLREGLAGPERVLLDPNTANAAGTVALDWWFPAEDGRLLAYGYSTNGDEKSTLYVHDVDAGRRLPDQIPHARFSSVAWEPDGRGFYYTRHPAPGSVPPGEEEYHEHVFYHRLGTDSAGDPDLFGGDREMTDMLQVTLAPEGRWLVVEAAQGWTRTELYASDRGAAESGFRPVVAGLDGLFSGVVRGSTLYMLTNWEASHYRVLAVDLEHPEPESWREIIPARPDVILEGMRIIGDRLILIENQDAVSRVGVYTVDGAPLAAPALPPLGSVAGLGGWWQGEDLFVGFESFTVPPTVYRYHLPSGALSIWAAVAAPFDLGGIAVEQVWYRSADGTRIPMFVVAPRDLPRTGDTPTVLNGYGGFNISNGPLFTRAIIPWVVQGGIYAVANLRGGSEYGEEWHRAGMLDKKQNVFDDFLAAAEHLIAAGYTCPARLGISGGSNGGLLVGAALTQRPDLFQAVVCRVPLLDMLRYHHFRIARLWIPEYGCADDPQQCAWLWAYSPYHHVRPGVDYPAVLFTTADSDSRVDPLHARKMAALLQSLRPRRPVLLRVETAAGHGAGKPLTKRIAEETDIWSFLAWQLGLPWAERDG